MKQNAICRRLERYLAFHPRISYSERSAMTYLPCPYPTSINTEKYVQSSAHTLLAAECRNCYVYKVQVLRREQRWVYAEFITAIGG